MKEVFNLSKESIETLQAEGYKQPFLEALKIMPDGLVPCVQISQKGADNSWYNTAIGEVFQLVGFYRRYEVPFSTGSEKYLNFLVKSRGKGTKQGYKQLGVGLDIVHEIAGKLVAIKLESKEK